MDQETTAYLREVFGCSLDDLLKPAYAVTLGCIRENAADGFPLDLNILNAVSDKLSDGVNDAPVSDS